MFRNEIHSSICSQHTKLSDWYCEKISKLHFPIYSSYDIRDAGFKVSNVDGNVYPAGFNNICPTDKESVPELFRNFLASTYPGAERILLITEEHTQNAYYWENVGAISDYLTAAGYKILIGFPKLFTDAISVKSATGRTFNVVSGFGTSEAYKSFQPQLVLSNNDFSLPLDDWAQSISIPIEPVRQLGWFQRKKSRYFYHYNKMVSEFADVVKFDQQLMRVETELFENFVVEDQSSADRLAERVDHMIETLREQYKQRKIEQEPFVFIKNNSGTYGLGVLRVSNGAEVKDWTYKSRKKMKAAKGGREIDQVIIQEGIPSRVRSEEGSSAEPVIYMVGTDLAGGFLRTHQEKGSTDSLNSPGAVYKKLCVSDLVVSLEGSPLENVYGWTARLGLLAIALEAQELSGK